MNFDHQKIRRHVQIALSTDVSKWPSQVQILERFAMSEPVNLPLFNSKQR